MSKAQRSFLSACESESHTHVINSLEIPKLPISNQKSPILSPMFSPRKPNQDPIEKIQSRVQCLICKRLVNDPRLLSCLHSFCRLCLSRLSSARNNFSIVCPQCRHETIMNSIEIEQLPLDIYKNDILSTITVPEAQTSTICNECEEDLAITHCNTCKIYLCDFHSLNHQKTKRTREHQLIPIEIYLRPTTPPVITQFVSLKPIGHTYCSEHEGKEISGFCSTCQIGVCLRCQITKHKQHQFVTMKQIDVTHREEVKRIVFETLMKLNDFDTASKRLTTVLDRIQSHSNELQQSIDQIFHQLIEKLNEQKTKIENHLHQLIQFKLKTLQLQSTELRSYLDELEQSCLRAIQLSFDNDPAFVHVRSIINKVLTLISDQIEPEDDDQFDLQINQQLIDQFQNQINQLLAINDRSTKKMHVRVHFSSIEEKLIVGTKHSFVIETQTRGGQLVYFAQTKINAIIEDMLQPTKQINYQLDDHQSGQYTVTFQCPYRETLLKVLVEADNKVIFESPSTIRVISLSLFDKLNSSNFRVLTSSAISPTSSPQSSLLVSESQVKLIGPTGIAIATSGELIVSDFDRNQLLVFDRNGTFLHYIADGSSLSTSSASSLSIELNKIEGQLSQPWGVAIDQRTGIVFVADSGSRSIQMFELKGKYLGKFAADQHRTTTTSTPTPEGSPVKRSSKLTAMGEHWRSVSFDSAESFLALRTSKTTSKEWNGKLSCPSGICVNFKGDVIVSDYELNCVFVYSSTGEFIRTIGEGRLSYPMGVAVNSRLEIFVCDCNHRRVLMFSENGQELKKFGPKAGMFDENFGGFDLNCAIYGDDRYLIVSDNRNNSLHFFDCINGDLICSYSSKGDRIGQFNAPTAIAIDQDNRIIICDSGNYRLQVIEL